MTKEEEISQAYGESSSYPELVQRLIATGVLNYTVDVSTGIILYRLENGQHLIQRGHVVNRAPAEQFNPDLVIQAIRENQQKKTTYPQFMNAIASAGVRFYEATLEGKKRVTYIGAQDEYQEEIPV